MVTFRNSGPTAWNFLNVCMEDGEVAVKSTSLDPVAGVRPCLRQMVPINYKHRLRNSTVITIGQVNKDQTRKISNKCSLIINTQKFWHLRKFKKFRPSSVRPTMGQRQKYTIHKLFGPN